MYQIDTLYLAESQNEEFDTEYHSAAELRQKVELIRQYLPDGPRQILDVGGGNGNFIDRMLENFPEAEGVNLDVSKVLLERNSTHPRKELICASVSEARERLGGRRFDVITLNWLLHHLVGPDYETCKRNCVATLQFCSEMLTPQGVIIVAENMFDGYWKTNVPSRVIYEITRIRQPLVVGLAGRFFNTAGVGVCFRSEKAWRRVFAGSSLSVGPYFFGDNWSYARWKQLMLSALFIDSLRHGHFFLRPSA